MGRSLRCRVNTLLEHISNFRRSGEKSRNLLRQIISGLGIGTSEPTEWKASHFHDGTGDSSERSRKILGCSVQRILRLAFQTKHGVFCECLESLDALAALVVVQCGVSQVNRAQGVGETAHEKFFEFQSSSKGEAEIGGECKVGRKTKKLFFVVGKEIIPAFVGFLRSECSRHRGANSSGYRVEEIAHSVTDNFVELLDKGLNGLLFL
mmetsp:Transcript_30044/g.59889  ORF Transcript_30044/g.59889 Transcript_30044/m.59889 type:complete len:208 (+) Transcript_30044:400-1023(+)